MIKRLLVTTIILTSIYSCGNDSQPKVVYDNNENNQANPPKTDTTSVEIADLPIRIDSTEYLIHPIGTYQIYKSRSKIISGSRYSGDHVNFSISNSSDNKITGNLTNLRFQHIDSDKLISLTDKTIKIWSTTFLTDVYQRIKVPYLLYRITDKDTNRDGKMDHQDLESLYLSKIDGSRFIKLTPEYHQFVKWHLIGSINRLYFKTVEDINKDGEFDRNDSIHYYYVNLTNDVLKTIEYYPLR